MYALIVVEALDRGAIVISDCSLDDCTSLVVTLKVEPVIHDDFCGAVKHSMIEMTFRNAVCVEHAFAMR